MTIRININGPYKLLCPDGRVIERSTLYDTFAAATEDKFPDGIYTVIQPDFTVERNLCKEQSSSQQELARDLPNSSNPSV